VTSAEGGRTKVPSWVGYVEGCPLHSRLGGLRESRDVPSEVRDGAPAGNAICRILKARECYFHLYSDVSVSCHIWGQGRGLGTVPPAPT